MQAILERSKNPICLDEHAARQKWQPDSHQRRAVGQKRQVVLKNVSGGLTVVVNGPTLKLPLLLMASKPRLASVEVECHSWPAVGPSCNCLAEFFREEFAKHSRCLQEQREYYSELAITQAEDALAKIMAELEQLCTRDDACEVVGQLLRQLDVVTNLSAWTEVHTLH